MRGFFLIEVLITLFLLTLGSVSLLHSQQKSFFQQRQLFWQQIAQQKLQEAVVGVNASRWNVREWEQALEQGLPHGTGEIAQSGRVCNVLIQWQGIERTEEMSDEVRCERLFND